MPPPRRKVRARDPSLGSIDLPSTPLTQAGERMFVKIAEEVMHGHRALFDTLTPHEKKLVLEWLADAIAEGKAETAVHDVLWEVDYHRKPPTIEEFVHSDEYMGRVASELHPQWKSDLFQIFAPGSQIFEWVLTGAIGIGKLCANDVRICTPDGWTTHGTVRVGDLVTGSNGRPTRVLGVYPHRNVQMYRVTFTDGTSLEVGGPHLWSVRRAVFVTENGRQRRSWVDEVIDTDTLRTRKLRNGDGYTHRIPLVEPVRYSPVRLRVPPYTLGALLGDGCLVKGSITLAGDDLEIGERVQTELPNLELTRHPDNRQWTISKGSIGGLRDSNWLMAEIRRLGLAGLSSLEKFVPDEYLRGTPQQRLDLLRGLMDTDGCVLSRNTATFSTSSQRLADGVVSLVQSLGGVACRTSFLRDGVGEISVRIALRDCPFYLPRKAAKWSKRTNQPIRRAIVSVEPTRVADGTCIRVEAADSLYVAEHFVVTHNTTLACVAQAYKLCLLSCLRDPARYYGLLTDSLIVFGIYSITKRQVSDAGYFKLRGFLDSSPYFLDKYPRNRKIDSKVQFLRQKVQIVPGSQEMHALGLDLFAFMMDEVNFMRTKESKEGGKMVGQAYDLYNATHTRMMSRFMRPGGTVPGMMILMSSRNSQTSFLEEHLKKVDPKRTFVSDYPLWAVKSKHLYTQPRFNVEVGDRTSRSRVLKTAETPRKGAKIIQIPGEFRRRFDEDVDQALRDLAGVATFNLSPLIRDRQSVFDAVHPDLKHPFTRDVVSVDFQDEDRIDSFFDLETVCRLDASVWKPKLNQGSPRFLHIDIGLTEDGLGLAMGHPAGTVRNERVNEDGTVSEIPNPVVIIDLMLRVVAPPGSEIDLGKVRSFIVYLSKLFNIVKVTFDRFQSADSIQILRKLGFEAGHLSVDRDDEAYVTLRSALFDRRVLYYEYGPFIDEVLDLERDAKERKVDHPVRSSKGGRGSKDVSDAVAGVVWHCTNDPLAKEAAAVIEIEASRVKINNRKQILAAAKAAVAEKQASLPGVAAWGDLQRNMQERL